MSVSERHPESSPKRKTKASHFMLAAAERGRSILPVLSPLPGSALDRPGRLRVPVEPMGSTSLSGERRSWLSRSVSMPANRRRDPQPIARIPDYRQGAMVDMGRVGRSRNHGIAESQIGPGQPISLACSISAAYSVDEVRLLSAKRFRGFTFFRAHQGWC
jgi:hypothetical protein